MLLLDFKCVYGNLGVGVIIKKLIVILYKFQISKTSIHSFEGLNLDRNYSLIS